MGYNLKHQNGIVNYLMMAGADIVLAQMSVDMADGVCKQNAPNDECIPGHPGYCVHAGCIYFDGAWEKPKAKKPVKGKAVK